MFLLGYLYKKLITTLYHISQEMIGFCRLMTHAQLGFCKTWHIRFLRYIAFGHLTLKCMLTSTSDLCNMTDWVIVPDFPVLVICRGGCTLKWFWVLAQVVSLTGSEDSWDFQMIRSETVEFHVLIVSHTITDKVFVGKYQPLTHKSQMLKTFCL